MSDFDSIHIYALLNNTWTSLSDDVKVSKGISARWGIYGYSPASLIADVGDLRFSLNNSTDQYNPDASSPLSGWGTGNKIKIVFTYDSIPYTRFLGYIPRNGIKINEAKSSSASDVDVTAQDWMKYAVNTPIISPSIEENKTADEALTTLLGLVPVSASLDADTGTYTFPTVFDGTNQNTTAYSEASRLVYSESPGRIYLIKQRDSGQSLVFENSTHRDSPTQKTTVSLAMNYWKNHDSGNWINHSGGKFQNHSMTESGSAVVTINSDIDAIEAAYGENMINKATVTAHPKRVDENYQVLYRLPQPIALANGESKTIIGRYVDPTGGGTRINAIVSSMQEPDAPGDLDPNLKCLITYEDSTFVDETGRHSITQNDATRFNTYYSDGYGNTFLTGGVFGSYTVYGGYSNYCITMPSSTDFDLFEGTPCTIGFYSALFNAATGNNILTRDQSLTFAPYVLGVPQGIGSDFGIYMSSNGSSWDVAAGKSWGPTIVNRWVYYELNYEDGWFYAFADGRLTDKWYSATHLPASSGTFSIGKTQSTYYGYFAHDMFFVYKGICLHKKDFDPPQRQMDATLDGDYLLNTASDGSGSDLSADLAVSVYYYPDKPFYTVTNNSGSDGYLIHLQARGRGLYNYDQITYTASDADSIAENGYQNLNIDQYYQQDIEAGAAWVDSIITAEASGRTVLRSVSFWANRTATNMLRFLQCDIGDLIRVVISTKNIDGYFHIQNVGFTVKPGNLVYVTWGLVEGNTP